MNKNVNAIGRGKEKCADCGRTIAVSWASRHRCEPGFTPSHRNSLNARHTSCRMELPDGTFCIRRKPAMARCCWLCEERDVAVFEALDRLIAAGDETPREKAEELA